MVRIQNYSDKAIEAAVKNKNVRSVSAGNYKHLQA